jgi:hypothetical protein
MYIREYADTGMLANGLPIGIEPANTDQFITFTATAGQSAAFKNNTRMVAVTVDGIASILFGTNPTAVTEQNFRLAAGNTYTCLVQPGSALKVSAVTST